MIKWKYFLQNQQIPNQPRNPAMAEDHKVREGTAKSSMSTRRLQQYLLYLIAMSCVILAYLYLSIVYQIQSPQPLRIARNVQPHWTWICQKNACRRIIASNFVILQSLSTCNMLCGSDQLWPQPTGRYILAKSVVSVKADNFTLQIAKTSSSRVTLFLKDAFALFKDDLRKIEVEAKSPIHLNRNVVNAVFRNVIVSVTVYNDGDPHLRLDTDESYELSVRNKNNKLIATVLAHSFPGARHGFETLSQLVWSEPHIGSLLAVETAHVIDSPKFKYRGLLLDTAQNYFPVKDIMRTIDVMGANKLNTFHWYATDTRTFSMKLKSLPELAKQAYAPGAVYTRHDIRAVVHRARVRGIRVVIELDAASLINKVLSFNQSISQDPNVPKYCHDSKPWKDCDDPLCEQLYPEGVYDLLEKIYAEIIELTGVNDVFHIGGGTIQASCWEIQRKKNDLKLLGLQYCWLQKTLELVKKVNNGRAPRLTILWSSDLTQLPYLMLLNKNHFTVQLRHASVCPGEQALLLSGFRSIISHAESWYFGSDTWWTRSNGSNTRTWEKVYFHRPWKNISRSRIAGGCAYQWSNDLGPEGLDSRLWPYGAALAERLWSDLVIQGYPTISRLDIHRSRMMARGIHMVPIWPRWCTQNPTACTNTF